MTKTNKVMTDEDFFCFHLLELYHEKDTKWTRAYRSAIRDGFKRISGPMFVKIVDNTALEIGGDVPAAIRNLLIIVNKFISEPDEFGGSDGK